MNIRKRPNKFPVIIILNCGFFKYNLLKKAKIPLIAKYFISQINKASLVASEMKNDHVIGTVAIHTT